MCAQAVKSNFAGSNPVSAVGPSACFPTSIMVILEAFAQGLL